MKLNPFNILYFICLLIPQALYASEPENADGLMKTADSFSACSGKYAALAEQFEKEGMAKEVIDSFKGNMRGSKMAAAVLIKAARNEKKNLQDYYPYIDSIAYPYKNQIALGFLDPAVSLEHILTEKIAVCTKLNPLQAKIINEVRRQEHLK